MSRPASPVEVHARLRIHLLDRYSKQLNTSKLLQLVDVIEDAGRDADSEYGEVASGLVANTPRNVDDHSLVQFNLLIVERHCPLSIDQVVELVGSLVIVQFRLGYLHMMDLRRGIIFLFDKTTDLAASFGPGFDRGGIASQDMRGGCGHGKDSGKADGNMSRY